MGPDLAASLLSRVARPWAGWRTWTGPLVGGPAEAPSLPQPERLLRRVGAAGVAGASAGVFLLPRHTSTTNPLSAAGPDGAWAGALGTARGLAAHLLRRSGFGYTDAELDAAASMKYAELVEKVTS